MIEMMKTRYSLADEDALKALLNEAYGLQIHSLELHRDIRGAVYFADTPHKTYVFKLSHTRHVQKSACAVNLINFLRNRGFPAVEVIPTTQGEPYITVPMPEGARTGVLYAYLDGKNADYNDIEKIGELTARLHNEMAAYGGELPLLYDKYLLTEELPELMRSIRYPEPKVTDIECVINAIWANISDFPPGVVHGDLDMGNTSVNNSTITLFDFDDAGRMPLIFDVACICNRTSKKVLTQSDIDLTLQTIPLFMKGYNKINPHAVFKTADILNWIAMRRADVQKVGINFVRPKEGNHNAHFFLDYLHKWLTDWERMVYNV